MLIPLLVFPAVIILWEILFLILRVSLLLVIVVISALFLSFSSFVAIRDTHRYFIIFVVSLFDPVVRQI